jgi:alanine-glyoxylate transaminase/(R)-3-amino-2-methylpropionate-pyruvate transaminase
MQKTNDELLKIRKNHFLPTANLYHAADPIHLVKAQGCSVYDDKGKKYLDGIGGIVCISAGHNHPKIKKALIDMLNEDQIQHTSMLYMSRPVADLTEKLVEVAPKGLDRVAITNSGSEANELAMMAARQATGETMVVNLRHGYHGGTSGTLASCGHHNWKFRAQPTTSVTSSIEPNCYRCPFSQKPDSCALECAKQVETTIQTTTHGKIAAMIVEPVMGVGGFITPPKEYFDIVTKTVHNYGGKYISDEVQTGAGRGGSEFLMTKELGIDADIITMAKGFGNGAAVGGVIMKTEVAEPMRGKLYFNTFGGDPFQCVQASVTMDIIKEENQIANAKAMGKLLMDGCKELMKSHNLIGDVRGRGLMIGIELVKDRASKAYASEETVKVMDLCKAKGLLIAKGGLFGNVLRIAPPLSINRDEIGFMLKVLGESFAEVEKSK